MIELMQGEHSSQSSFFGMIYEELIPADHLLRELSAAVDFSFVSELVKDCYCPDNGRPSWDPLVLFKVVFVQFLYDLSELCRRLGLQITVYYRWLKDFLEAGKQRLRGDTLGEAGHDEVRALKEENGRLKQLVADYALEVMALKKSLLGER